MLLRTCCSPQERLQLDRLAQLVMGATWAPPNTGLKTLRKRQVPNALLRSESGPLIVDIVYWLSARRFFIYHSATIESVAQVL